MSSLTSDFLLGNGAKVMAVLLVIETHAGQLMVAIDDSAAPHHIGNWRLVAARHHTVQDVNHEREPRSTQSLTTDH